MTNSKFSEPDFFHSEHSDELDLDYDFDVVANIDYRHSKRIKVRLNKVPFKPRIVIE